MQFGEAERRNFRMPSGCSSGGGAPIFGGESRDESRKGHGFYIKPPCAIIGGTATSLGNLYFSYLNLAGGAFATTVTGSGIIGPAIPVNNPDFIRVTGTFYVAGDPSQINVQSAPEPTSLALMAASATTLLGFRRHRASRIKRG